MFPLKFRKLSQGHPLGHAGQQPRRELLILFIGAFGKECPIQPTLGRPNLPWAFPALEIRSQLGGVGEVVIVIPGEETPWPLLSPSCLTLA